MRSFRATVRVRDLKGTDVRSVRDSLEQRLRSLGSEHWRVVDVSPVDSVPRLSKTAVQRLQGDRAMVGRLMLLGAAGWALWFFSLFTD